MTGLSLNKAIKAGYVKVVVGDRKTSEIIDCQNLL